MDELKPCPFCGRQVEIVEEGDYLEIVCEECGIAMNRGSYERIIADWNRRTEPPESEINNERFLELCKQYGFAVQQDSQSPGIFLRQKDGTLREVTNVMQDSLQDEREV